MHLPRRELLANSLGCKGGGKRHLFATLSVFPVLVPYGAEPSLFSGHPLVLLEGLANCASGNLGVFVVPVYFINSCKSVVEKHT